jgi:hypothetical protein
MYLKKEKRQKTMELWIYLWLEIIKFLSSLYQVLQTLHVKVTGYS